MVSVPAAGVAMSGRSNSGAASSHSLVAVIAAKREPFSSIIRLMRSMSTATVCSPIPRKPPMSTSTAST